MDHVTSTYAKIAKQYAEEFSLATDSLDDFLGLLSPGSSILDMGCGPGVEIAHCKEKGFKVEGIDLSAEMVDLARHKNPEVKISLANILEFNTSQKYDSCIASYSLIHLPKKNLPEALSNIHSCLKKDGYLYVAVHEGQSNEGLYDEPFDPSLKIFLNIFTKEEISELLIKTGFRIVETKTRDATSSEEFSFRKLILFAQAI